MLISACLFVVNMANDSADSILAEMVTDVPHPLPPATSVTTVDELTPVRGLTRYGADIETPHESSRNRNGNYSDSSSSDS